MGSFIFVVFFGQVYTQEDVDQTISEHKCQMANFYKMMADYRRKELLCQGFTVKDSAEKGLGDMVLVPSPGATIILDGTDPWQHGEWGPCGLGKSKPRVHFEGTFTAIFCFSRRAAAKGRPEEHQLHTKFFARNLSLAKAGVSGLAVRLPQYSAF